MKRESTRLVWNQLVRVGVLCVVAAVAGCPPMTPEGNGNDNTDGDGTANRSPAIVVTGSAGIDPTAITVEVGSTLTLSAAGSRDEDGDALAFTWDFGDGTPTATGPEVSHVYTQTGSFTLVLTVDDGRGLTTSISTREIPVTVAGASPVALFTFTPSSGTAPLTVDFDANLSSDADGSIVSYDWDFGDSGTGIGVTTSHTYTTGGTFTITLTVTDDDGNTGTDSGQITVTANSNPTAVANADVTMGSVPLEVQFDGSESFDPEGDDLTFDWDFGDGSDHSDTESPLHTYNNEGTYTVTLTVTDEAGAIGTDTLTITAEVANTQPTAVITADVTEGSAPLTVNFDGTDSSDAESPFEDLKWCWEFGEDPDEICDYTIDGTPSHTYTDPGTYTASLYVSDEMNLASEVVTIEIEVTDVSLDSISVSPTCAELTLTAPEDTAQLEVDGIDDNGVDVLNLEDDGITEYASSDEAVATVDANGVVTAVAEGMATITVSRADGSVTPVTTDIFVGTTLPVFASMEASPNPLDLILGTPQQLTVTGISACDPATTIPWSADAGTLYTEGDDTIIEVSDTGLVTPLAEGVTDITVSRPEALVADVVIPVTVTTEPLTATALVTNLEPEGYVFAADLGTTDIQLDVDVAGGVKPYSYDWNIVTVPGDSAIDDSALGATETQKVASFTPDVEGVYEVECVVTDALLAEDTSNTLSITFSSITGPTWDVNGDAVEDIDGTCTLAIPSDNTPNGANGPGTLGNNHPGVLLDGGTGGSLGNLQFLWSTDPDIGTFDAPIGATPTWDEPNFDEITGETPVVFSVVITDADKPEVEITFSFTINVIPPPELTDICDGVEVPDCSPGPIVVDLAGETEVTQTFTFWLVDGIDGNDYTMVLSRTDSDPPDPVTIGSECSGGDDLFGEEPLECTVTFETEGTYTLRMRIKHECAADGQSGGSTDEQRLDTSFDVEVVDNGL